MWRAPKGLHVGSLPNPPSAREGATLELNAMWRAPKGLHVGSLPNPPQKNTYAISSGANSSQRSARGKYRAAWTGRASSAWTWAQ